jgi:hypothetical protein
LIVQVSLRFENISKALSISQLQALLEVLQSLLKAEHFGPMRNGSFPPPFWSKSLEVRLVKPEVLKSEGLTYRSAKDVQVKLNKPMVRA